MTASVQPARRPVWVSAARPVLACAVLALAGPLARADDAFETPPEQSPSVLLPDLKVSGDNYHVVDPVLSDGLRDHYVVVSKYGKFDGYGKFAARVRIHEVEALNELAKASDIEVFAGGAVTGVGNEIKTVGQVVKNPFKVVVGIPTGIGHMFQGYTAKGEELADSAKRSTSGSGSGSGAGSSATHAADAGADAAKKYADHYLGVSAAERRWYEKLAVDPYTNNQTLKNAVSHAAKVDAAGNFGMRFVGLAGIPGIDIVQRSMDAIYHEDPAAIRKRNRETLATYGLTPDEIRHWQDTFVLSPTRQVLLMEAAKSLDGVDGRGEIFRHAIGLTSDAEAQVYVQSVGLLTLAHRAAPLARILPGVRLPTAARANGDVVVAGAFDALYWTLPVADGEAQIRQLLPPDLTGARQFWLAGEASERAQKELAARGWELHHAAEPAPAAH